MFFRSLALFTAIALVYYSASVFTERTSFLADNLVELTPNEYLPALFAGSQLAVGEGCESETVLKKYNTDWEVYLGFDSSLTWKDGATLWVNIRRLLKNGGIDSFQKICTSRDLFVRSFGQLEYYQCINMFSLMKYTTNFTVAATYVRMWQNLDFLCNVGYEQLISPGVWQCVSALNENGACNNAYQNSVNYTNVCPAVQNYMQCVKLFFDKGCNRPNGYYACEDIRLGYGAHCNLRCFVEENVF